MARDGTGLSAARGGGSRRRRPRGNARALPGGAPFRRAGALRPGRLAADARKADGASPFGPEVSRGRDRAHREGRIPSAPDRGREPSWRPCGDSWRRLVAVPLGASPRLAARRLGNRARRAGRDRVARVSRADEGDDGRVRGRTRRSSGSRRIPSSRTPCSVLWHAVPARPWRGATRTRSG